MPFVNLSNRQLVILLYSIISFIFHCNHQAFALTFTVDSNGSESDTSINGVCETSLGACTLHAAIQEANNAPGTIILFDAPHTISDCSLPALSAGSTTINGYNQWDTTNDRPGVVLETPLACGAGSTVLTINSDNNHIYGLSFENQTSADSIGIKIASGSDNNTIGTDIEMRRNLFLTAGYGVKSLGSNNSISSNYFGTVNGTSCYGVRGTFGIQSWGTNNHISNNLIVGQRSIGIDLAGNGNTIEYNIIGVNKYKQKASSSIKNYRGIVIGSGSDNTINNNVIGDNDSYGIYIYFSSNDNDIHHNEIGIPWSISDLGNRGTGIAISSGNGNTIRNNHIVDNDGSGIVAETSNITIQGNIIRDNQLHGVHFAPTATGVVGGGDTPGLRNSIFANSEHGIYLEGSSSVTISGNLIGLDAGGTDKGNLKCGIFLDSGANGNIIGGNSAGDANWIGWNHLDGIKIDGASASNNTVKNNILGAPTGFNWQAANRRNGITIAGGTHDNTIGGDAVGNTILASGAIGIAIGFSDNNSLVGNKIGTDGTHNWGNTQYGIVILEGAGTLISANEIAYNGSSSSDYDGIAIAGTSAIHNRISENSIYENGGKGINLQGGANSAIASPVISREGHEISGTACPGCTVELFSDTHDEGRFFEGSVVTSPAGIFSWTGSFRGQFITATATDAALNTSMFSTPVRAPFPWAMFMPAFFTH